MEIRLIIFLLGGIFLSNDCFSQNLNKYGQVTSSASDIVNKNGAVGLWGIRSTGENIPYAPIVITSDVTDVTATTATGNGTITSTGGAAVTASGVCWSTSTGPTTSGNRTTDGSGIGSFNSAVTGLTSGTKYYVRAYVTTSIATAYGEEVSFTTSLARGTLYQGGTIIYIYYTDTGIHGYIVAKEDVGWYPWTDAFTACDNYINPDTGTGSYSDWHLPGMTDLYNIQSLLSSIPDIILLGAYWSSEQYSSTDGKVLNFNTGLSWHYPKSFSVRVRAVRYF